MNRFLNPLLDRFPLGIVGTRPIDIVDLLWHAFPWVLLAPKLVRVRRRSH